MFGVYIVDEGVDLHRIYATTNHPSRMYFNECDAARDGSRVDFLGIEDAL